MAGSCTTRERTSAFRHGLRVRMGATGPTGMLLQCERKAGPGHYWKVRLQSGAWVWPDGLIVDGVGDQVATCKQCALPFMTTKDGDGLLCRRCDEEMYGTQTRAGEPLDLGTTRTRTYVRRPRDGSRR